MTIQYINDLPEIIKGKDISKYKHQLFTTDSTRMNQDYAETAAQIENGQVYTGIHKVNDWSKTAYWEKGWHIVNRTGEYVVVIQLKQEANNAKM